MAQRTFLRLLAAANAPEAECFVGGLGVVAEQFFHLIRIELGLRFGLRFRSRILGLLARLLVFLVFGLGRLRVGFGALLGFLSSLSLFSLASSLLRFTGGLLLGFALGVFLGVECRFLLCALLGIFREAVEPFGVLLGKLTLLGLLLRERSEFFVFLSNLRLRRFDARFLLFLLARLGLFLFACLLLGLEGGELLGFLGLLLQSLLFGLFLLFLELLQLLLTQLRFFFLLFLLVLVLGLGLRFLLYCGVRILL